MEEHFNANISLVLVLPKPLEEYTYEEQKNICEEKMRSYIDESDFNFYAPKNSKLVETEKQKDAYCRRIYQNTSISSDFDYLYRNLDKKVKTQTGAIKTLTLKQPAEVRHIPIVSSKLRALKSRELMRPFKINAYAIDRDTLEQKSRKKIKDVLDLENKKINNKLDAIYMNLYMVQQKKEMLQQLEQYPEYESMVMQINIALNNLQEDINRSISLTEEEKEYIEKYYRYTYKDIQEVLVHKLVNAYIENNRLRQLFNKAFEEKLITDKPIYYIDWIDGQDQPVFELVRPEYFEYQYSEECDYIEDLGWCTRLRYMTFQQIIAEYGKYLTEDQVTQIKNEMPRQHARSSSNLTNLPDGQYIGYDERNHHNAHNELYPVYHVYWKEYVAIPALIKKNDKQSKFYSSKPDFVRFLGVDEAKKMVNTKAKKDRLKRRGEKIEVRHRMDLWEGIRIGMETYITMGKRENVQRDPKNLSDVKLPFIGKNIHRFQQARSLVWETRDIQELINILHYQEELLIALAGVRGIVYDLAQKPDGMSPAEVNYYMRQGIMYIKTVKKNNKKINTSFNQFQTFDQSLSPSVGLIDNMKASLINLVSMITGIYNNLEGQVANSDQVGTMKMSIQQSSASVETYYQEHEDLVERALTRLANIYKDVNKKELNGSYVLNKIEHEIFKVPQETLKGQYKILINAGLKEKEAIDNARQIALAKYQRGELKGSEYLTLLDLENVHEMREYFATQEKKMYEIAQQSQQQQQQAASQAQQQAIQMQAEMEMRLKQMDAQMEQRMKELDLMVKNRELQIKEQDVVLSDQQAREKIAVEREKMESERDIELRYLDFQKQELAINARTQRAQVLLQDIKNKIEVTKSRSKEKIKD